MLLDAKGNYTEPLKQGWAQNKLLTEAKNQKKAANGTLIEWHFQHKEDAETVEKYFKNEKFDFSNFKIIYTPKK